MKDFNEILKSCDALPTLPVVVTRVLQVVSDNKSNVRDLVEIIQNDQAISGKILRVANSAYYGLSRNVDSMSQAVVLLGFDTIRALSLGVGVLRLFHPPALQEVLDMEQFWQHSIATAVCADMLWKDKQFPGRDEVFLAGLLHDIGRLAFITIDGRTYGRLLRDVRQHDKRLVEAEEEEFGGTHADLGAQLCENWRFSDVLVEPIRFHHNAGGGATEDTSRRVAAVTVANCLSHRRRIGWAVEASPPEIPAGVLDILGMTEQRAEELGDRLERRREDIESFTKAIS